MQKSIVDDAPQDAENEINLTPMLDVVFIMLIFFIVTASFIKETGIDVSRPNAPRAVRANIERMHAENPDASVVIQPDRRSFNDTLVQVMDASREAGVYDISIAADSDTGGAQ
jgi:biopolymer transport protein ExbD